MAGVKKTTKVYRLLSASNDELINHALLMAVNEHTTRRGRNERTTKRAIDRAHKQLADRLMQIYIGREYGRIVG